MSFLLGCFVVRTPKHQAEAHNHQALCSQEAWSTLCSLPDQKKQKAKVLIDFLTDQEGGWAQQMLTRVEQLSMKDSHIEEEEEFTRGQLEMLHGIQETSELIAKGKFEEKEDEDGDLVYIRKRKVHRVAAEKSQSYQLQRTASGLEYAK